MKRPKTSDEVAEMLRTGKVIDAAVRRAVREAVGKTRTRAGRSGTTSKRRKGRRRAA